MTDTNAFGITKYFLKNVFNEFPDYMDVLRPHVFYNYSLKVYKPITKDRRLHIEDHNKKHNIQFDIEYRKKGIEEFSSIPGQQQLYPCLTALQGGSVQNHVDEMMMRNITTDLIPERLRKKTESSKRKDEMNVFAKLGLQQW